jgi:type I restriction enzyme, R subunit
MMLMSKSPEEQAREAIDAALEASGWSVQDAGQVNLDASRGVAIRNFPLKSGHGFADYLLYIDRKAAGIVEAKKAGSTLTGVEPQTAKYSTGMPNHLPRAVDPLPFLYQSTGVETRFTDLLDPEPRSRHVFTFHRPDELAADLALVPPGYPFSSHPSSLRARLQYLPEIDAHGLWKVQHRAIESLERSLKANRPRALIQMATGSGKTFTAISAAYRLIKFARARRILFLVDRANLGRQALKEFQQYTTPDDGRKFTELYNVQHLTFNKLDPVANVVISTIQRLYSMLQGKELESDLEEGSLYDSMAGLVREPVPVEYSPGIPIGSFDVIFIDECHRSIYDVWGQVLEYFDAFLIGLTATPSKPTFGFFRKNLVMEYSHEDAVADGVNVDFDVYNIRTRITERGSTVESGFVVEKRDRRTRRRRWETLDEDFVYPAQVLDRDVVAVDQIRTIIRTFKEKLFTEIFPGRTEVPKTLIYAKDDNHAENIVEIVREEFDKGNDFAQKITYRTTGAKPEDLINSFRTRFNPRIAVTVDMIATGTDIKPLEIVMFMRAVKSRSFFEQMKGRGVRVILPTDFQAVTPGDKTKDHFVLVDCVGVTEAQLAESYSLERKRSASFKELLDAIAWGSVDPEVVSSLAGRLARLNRRLGLHEQLAIQETSGGSTLADIVSDLIAALDPDRQTEEARRAANLPAEAEPGAEELKAAEKSLIRQAVAPLASNPALRNQLHEYKDRYEHTYDHVSIDEVREAGFSGSSRQKAENLVRSFEQFVEDHRDEITALQILYSRPYKGRLRLKDVKDLADLIQSPPRSWTPEKLWNAYEVLVRDKVRGASGGKLLTDIVSLVRFALHPDEELIPFKDRVEQRYRAWLAHQETNGRRFTPEQLQWIDLIRDHIVGSLQMEMDDFDAVPFSQKGGLGRAYEVFGSELGSILDELNEVLAA